jgi:hypothetical protein
MIMYEDQRRNNERRFEEGEGVLGKREELVVDKQELGAGVRKNGGDVASVEARVDGVENSSGHWNGEMRLVKSRNIRSQN